MTLEEAVKCLKDGYKVTCPELDYHNGYLEFRMEEGNIVLIQVIPFNNTLHRFKFNPQIRHLLSNDFVVIDEKYFMQ